MSADTETWAETACILCECNYGIEVQLDGPPSPASAATIAEWVTRGFQRLEGAVTA